MAGNSIIGALRVNLGLNSAQFSSGLKQSRKRARSFASQISSAFKVASVAIAAAGAVASAAIKGTINEMDRYSKAAKGIGMTTEELGRLSYAAELSGVEFDKLTSSMGKLSKSISDSLRSSTSEQALAFKALSINVQEADGSLKSNSKILGEIADKFKNTANSTEKTAIAMALFGRSGAKLIPLLNEGSAGISKLGDEAERLGIVFDSKTAAAAERFNDTLTRIGKSSKGIWAQITAGVLPALQGIASRFVLTSTHGEGMRKIIDLLINVFNRFAQAVVFVIDNIHLLVQAVKVFLAVKIVMFLGSVAGAFFSLAKSIRVAGLAMGAFTAVQRMGMKGIMLLAGGIAIATGQYERLEKTMVSLWNRVKGLIPEDLRQKAADLFPDLDMWNADVAKSLGTFLNASEEARNSVGAINKVKLNKITSSISKVGETIRTISPLGQTLSNSFSSALDAIGEKTLKVGQFFRQLAKDIVKTFANRALMQAMQMLFPTGGFKGVSLTGMSAPVKLPGFANGGSFRVGGTGGIDSQLVRFKASPNETVTITKPGQNPGGGSKTVVKVFNYTGAPVTENRRKSGGIEFVDILVGTVNRAIKSGEMDGALGEHFNLSPATKNR